jgi:hypothetical protein
MPDEPGAGEGAVEELTTGEVATGFQEVVAEVKTRRDRLDAMPDGPRPNVGGRPYRRRRYMVDLPLQLSYVGVYLSTIVLLVVGFIALNYVFAEVYQRALKIQTYGRDLLPGSYPPGMVLMVLVNFVFVMLLLIGAAVYAIVHSHRVAGPAYRLRVALGHLQARDYDHYVQLRRRDFLHDLAEHVNVLNQALKAKDIVIAEAVLRLDEAAREAPGPVAERLQEVAADLSDVVLAIEDAGAAAPPEPTNA